ncbi:hypothetical protein SDC9_78030 [bioreactor metagenome]|uniref:Uncharacterized protein n=1 Tax=bioreactor metagenome TaxID=1076179 RepID=A0A644YSB4_9ZZZZ
MRNCPICKCSKSKSAQIFDRIAENGHPFAFARQFSPELIARPTRRVVRRQERLGVGHQSEDAAGLVADARDRIQRPVRIGRKFRGDRTVGIGIAEHHQILHFDLPQSGGVGHEFALAVAQRQPDQIKAAGENARARRVGPQSAPVIAEEARIVVRQRRLLYEILAVERRDQAQPGNGLEAVADADDQFAVGDEAFELVAQLELNTIGENRARAEMVAEGKSADESQNPEFVQGPPPCDQIIQMHLFGLGADIVERGRRLLFAIQSEAGDYQYLDFTHRFFLKPQPCGFVPNQVPIA